MANRIPSSDFTPFDMIGAEKPIKTAGGKASTDSFMVPVGKLNVIDDFNIRIDSPARRAHVAALVESIKQHGFRRSKPLEVLSDTEGTLFITDGHARLEAVLEYNRTNKPKIDSLPVVAVPQGSSVEDITAAFVLSNTGQPLTPLEVGIVCARLKKYGQADDKIAKGLGITTKYMKDLLTLVDAPPAVKNMVINNTVAPTTAIAALRDHGSDAAKVLKDAAAATAGSGKGRVTPKAVRAAAGKGSSTTKEGVTVISFKAGTTYADTDVAVVESLPGDSWFRDVDDKHSVALRNIKVTVEVGPVKEIAKDDDEV
jgi:ParB family transcriptional regulator, chromosome partitioning protein